MVCVVCHRPTFDSWICKECAPPYERAWVVGERSGVLQRLIGLYKFERARAAYKPLADMLSEVLPELPSNTVIVPVPTISSHIRERGYDHMLLISRRIARQKGLSLKRLLIRTVNTKQHQASAAKREAQSRVAFAVKGNIDPNVPYLLVDDVVTTGSTIKYAARTLRRAGAKHVWVAIIARQTLD